MLVQEEVVLGERRLLRRAVQRGPEQHLALLHDVLAALDLPALEQPELIPIGERLVL